LPEWVFFLWYEEQILKILHQSHHSMRVIMPYWCKPPFSRRWGQKKNPV